MYKSEHLITSKHYLVLAVASFSFGIFVSLMEGIGVALILLGCFLLLLSVSLPFAKRFLSCSINKLILLSCCLLIAFSIGVLRIELGKVSKNSLLNNLENQEAWLYGTILEDPTPTSNGHYYSFEFGLANINDFAVRETIILYYPKALTNQFRAGDTIFCWAEINSYIPDDTAHYGGDFYTHLWSKNIFFTGKTKNINIWSSVNSGKISPLRSMGIKIRALITNSIDKLFSHDVTSAAILKGILIGDKSGFDDQMYEKFSNSGISHVVAVSGLHVSALFGFLIAIFSALHIKRRFFYLLTIPFIIVFMSASAFTPSVCRASFMLLMTILASLTYAEADSVTSLFASLGILLFHNPYSIFSKSLILSFSAVLGILVFYNYLYQGICQVFRLTNTKKSLLKGCLIYPLTSFALSLSTLLGAGFFLVLFFNKLSKVQFFTNIWIIPLASIVFYLGYILCFLFYIFPWLSANFLKFPLQICLDLIKLTVDYFGDSRFAYDFDFSSLTLSHAAVYFGGVFIIYMTLKAFHDIREQKKIAAGKSSRLLK